MGAADGGALERGRAAYRRRDWPAAAELLEQARSQPGSQLSADDLFALADAAWWLGDVERSVAAAESAYRSYLQSDRTAPAAMAAMTVAINLLLRGDQTLGSGWMSRAVRLVADQPDAVQHHYLRYLTEVEGGIDAAATLPDDAYDVLVQRARDTQAAGRRLGETNLLAAGTMAEGRLMLKRGRADQGLRLLDEALLCLLDEDLAPDWAGSVYCHLMAAAHEVGDVARLRRWTDATERWLTTMPAAVLFRGICRVHRSQVLRLFGAWDRAEAEVERVCDELDGVAPGPVAEAFYQLGELRRLRGDGGAARAAYRRAHESGRDPQPGMALLRLAEGRTDAALRSIRAALVARRGDPLGSAPLWMAQVRIALAAGEVGEADQACAELESVAGTYGTSGLTGEALTARGSVELGSGRVESALPILREACRRWRELGADYDAARVCALLAEAYRRLGDDDAAEEERAAAVAVFDRLGVAAPARQLAIGIGPEPQPTPPPTSFPPPSSGPLPDGLTAREVEVLAAVAVGASNREVAAALTISEKTVARHLSNIFTKIGVGTRTEAAAYAFRRGLVGRSTHRPGAPTA